MLHYLSQQLAPAPRSASEHVLLENVSRRAFLKGSAWGAGLVVAMQILPFNTARAFESYPTGGLDMPNGIVSDPHVFVAIDPDGTVTIVAHRSEMGAGTRTSLPMVLADEMEADWARVRIVQAPGDEPKYGNQDTDGSRSMRHHIQPMRQMGAAVRQMLEQAAANQWGVDIAEVKATNHEVVHAGSGRRLGYGELAEAAMAMPTPTDQYSQPGTEALKYKTEGEFRYIGKGRCRSMTCTTSRPARRSTVPTSTCPA
jgi:isoquinoline 1-oxidoreductase beta subunit